jgi:CHASE2 domain-containing sensor protein
MTMMLIGAGAVLLVLALYALNALRTIELQSVDTRFSLRGGRKPPPNLVIVGIDSPTFAALKLQSSQFPRSLDARVIENLKRDGARVIVYDIQFTEPTTPIGNSSEAVEEAVKQDNDLIEAVGRAGNVVLATSEVGPHGQQDILGGGGILERIHARPGSAEFPIDSDGVDRRMFHDVRGLKTLGIVAAEIAKGRAIPASALGGETAWIDFAGGPGTIPEVPFVTVLQGRAPAADFAGKTVVVGATVSNLHDTVISPFGSSELMSGPELVAESIATAEAGFPLQPSGTVIDILLILALGLLAPAVSVRYSPGWVIALSAAVAVAYAVSVQRAFEDGRILPLTYPLLAVVLGCAGAVVADSFGERRQLQALGHAIGSLGEGARFFICYRRDQSRWPAGILHRELAKRFGESSAFMDKAAIDAGGIWPRRIEEALASCSVMLVLIGRDWVQARDELGARRLDDPRDWVRREIEGGLRAGVVLVPVLLDGASMPAVDQLPDELKPLADCNAIALAGDDPEAEIDQLVESITHGRMRDYLEGARPASAL